MADGSYSDVELFAKAIQLSSEERAEFLDVACAGDLELRRRIDALLKYDNRLGNFLEEPPTLSIRENRAKIIAGEKPGDWVGRYQLLKEIGEGGYGMVFLAEQHEPIRRLVALKVIKPGMETKGVIARFEAERQALALMDHPNIAHVFDAGATVGGRPYFVMEFVEGVKLTEYCDRESLSITSRLELFIQVCDAIQHAHQKGIIHRDIKPSNILVAKGPGGQPMLKVIDFGIAKATGGQRLTDDTVFTAHGMLIGTPAYMSPEQAALMTADVDTRTDIYSLGVLLYELLTGTTPFDTRELLKAGFDEVRRVIRDQEPVRPSTRLSSIVASDPNLPRSYRIEASKVVRQMRGDLDWIVMKALEKDRTRRYASANGLAMDVQRYLTGDAISARPPDSWYRFRKLVVRHRLVFGSLAAISVTLLTGLVVVTIALSKEQAARRETESQRIQSDEVTRFLEEMLDGVTPAVAMGKDTELLKEILDKTSKRIEAELTNQPAVQADLQYRLGVTYKALNEYKLAESMLRKSIAIRSQLSRDSSETADAINELAKTLMFQVDISDAESLARNALSMRKRLLGEEHVKIAESHRVLGVVLLRTEKLDEAEIEMRKSLEMNRKLLGENNARIGYSYGALAILYMRRQNYAEAEKLVRKSIENQKVLGENHPSVMMEFSNLSLILSAQGKHAEADEAARLGANAGLRMSSEKHPHPQLGYSLASAGRSLLQQGKYKEAEKEYREALSILRRFNSAQLEDISIYKDFVDVLMAQGKVAEAEQIFASLLPATQKLEKVHVQTVWERSQFWARRGRWNDAIADVKFVLGYEPGNHHVYHALAPMLVASGEIRPYQELCSVVVARFAGATNEYTADQMAKDCLILPDSGADLKVVGQLADVAVTRGKKSTSYSLFQFCKALAEYRQGNLEAAIQWAQEAQKHDFPYSKCEASAVLAMAFYRLEKFDGARAALAEAEKVRESLPKIESGDLGQDWRDWIIVQALLAEAKQIMSGGSASGASPARDSR